jgi:hypothetical protein
MTKTEERLADALDAAARALREDTLRPLQVPQRSRHRSAMAAPLAAAAALLAVVGIGVAAARYLPGSGLHPGVATGRPRYYVEADANGDLPVVRSTASGAVTATVQLPYARYNPGARVVTAAADGTFFTAVMGSAGELIYRFRLTAAGRVQGLTRVPGVALASRQWEVGVMAASPDGSRLAVSLTPTPVNCSSSCTGSASFSSWQNDQIEVIDTLTGARSVWTGGIAPNFEFAVLSLSWTSNASELVYFGQWCRSGNANLATCEPGTGTGAGRAEVRTLNPASRGGSLTSGRLLFELSPKIPDVPQAMISPDGSSIIAAAITGRVAVGGMPSKLTVERISVATGRVGQVLYSRDLSRIPGATYSHTVPNTQSVAIIGLSLDGAGQHWLLSGTGQFCGAAATCTEGFNGWIDDRRLVPLPPTDGTVASEAW